MQGTLRSTRFSTVVLLLVCALPSLAHAQRFVCSPIGPGDTATSLARRLTGSAAAAYDHVFQIRDPVRQMFVPKSHYQRLQSDWQACVASGPVRTTPVAFAPEADVAMSAAGPGETASPAPALAAAPLTIRAGALPDIPYTATIGAALLVIGLLSAVTGSLPRPMPAAVRRAGENFVRVFAEPLVDPSSAGPPIHARFRFARRTQQLEISLAPGPGHRYPNLADHKYNVEYDVERVMQILRNFVVSAPPRAAGKWVVVAIRPRGTQQGPQ